jgi:tetratricopeptide (TPR) repeat protein
MQHLKQKMKKYIIQIIFTFLVTNLFSQNDYFLGNKTYCNFPESERAKEIFPIGIKCIQNNIYLGTAFEIFNDVINIDSTFCDAYFWAGYTLRLSNKNKEAFIYYYIADSLAQNKSIEFKQNLANISMQIGLDSVARKKYQEMTEHFPNSPEGYYGVALTSIMIGDIENGLNNINIAEVKYNYQNNDAILLKAILLTLNNKHNEAINYYEKVNSKNSKEDKFYIYYAISLFEVATLNNDEKMIKQAKKYYQKIKNKTILSQETKLKFEK